MAKKSTTADAVKSAKKLYKKNPKLFIAVAVVVVIIVGAFVAVYFTHPEWFTKPMPESGELTVYFLDIGQGDCIYIAFPDGKDMLIDCGSTSGMTETKALQKIDNLVTDGAIDYIFITHPDKDHVSYMDEVIENYAISNIYLPYTDIDGIECDATTEEKALFDGGYESNFCDDYETLIKNAFAEENCVVNRIYDSFEININEDVSFKVYALDWVPDNVNALSPICLLTYANRTIVFTGDAIEEDTNNYIEKTIATDCDVLKVAHHGSHTNGSNSDDFLDDITVEYAVISVGDAYGHPHDDVLQRLIDHNITYYCTDDYGTVTLTIDHTGEMEFVTEKAA